MNIQAGGRTLADLTPQKTRFVIPKYQRPYSWEKEQVEELWRDIEALLDEEVSEHFFGPILSVKKKSEGGVIDRELIDGQQRITTIFLWLSALRDLLVHAGADSEGSAFIDNTLLWMGPPKTKQPRLVLQEPENSFLREVILAPKLEWNPEKPTKRFQMNKLSRSERRLAKNYETLVAFLWEKARKSKEGIEEISIGFQERLYTGMLFIHVEAEDIDSAYSIFSSLNSKGLPLSAGDLIKVSLIESIAGNDSKKLDDFSDSWIELTESIEETTDFTVFLRQWWLSHTKEKVTKDKLYRLLNVEIKKSSANANQIFKEILKAGESFTRLTQPTESEFKDKRAFRALSTISKLRATLCYPVLLQALLLDADDVFVDLCVKLESLTIRYSTLAKKASKNLENMIQDSANRLRVEGKKAHPEIVNRLRGLLPDDDTIRKEFFEDTPSKNQEIILGRLAFPDPETEIKIFGTDTVHIEHIMPQKLSSSWRKQLGDDGLAHLQYLYRWGNLTLLSGKKNIRASNYEFSEKIKEYKKSDIPMTKQLAKDHSNWDYKLIEERTKTLAEIALKVWPTF